MTTALNDSSRWLRCRDARPVLGETIRQYAAEGQIVVSGWNSTLDDPASLEALVITCLRRLGSKI